jgi:hypothetical protein
MTISGRGFETSAWRRSRWKYWAGVVQLATRMFPSAADCRKRSSRALECSGPDPSYPCGSNRLSREVWPHFASPETRNWSTITWAEFTKSPNWASQSTRASGAWTL